MTTEYPPSRVRILSHEALSATEVSIRLEIVVDVHRLTEIGHDFLSQAVDQIAAKSRKPE